MHLDASKCCFDELGACLVPQMVDNTVVARLRSEIAAYAGEARYGIRHANRLFPTVDAVANRADFLALAAHLLGSTAQPVRTLVFDKQPAQNWLVTWHQDRTIEVARREERDGWGPWSVKDGGIHVQPPADLLESMVALRLHLDITGTDNGCLHILPGTHRQGLLDAAGVAAQVSAGQSLDCVAAAGDVLAMRPLLLHASSRSRKPGHRRVIHIEYCAGQLPPGWSWT